MGDFLNHWIADIFDLSTIDKTLYDKNGTGFIGFRIVRPEF